MKAKSRIFLCFLKRVCSSSSVQSSVSVSKLVCPESLQHSQEFLFGDLGRVNDGGSSFSLSSDIAVRTLRCSSESEKGNEAGAGFGELVL